MRAHPHERFSSTVRLSPSAVATYAQAAGDDNPVHHDPSFAASTRFGRVIASGTHTTALLLGLKGKSLHKFTGGFERPKYPLYDQPRPIGIRCANKNCIVHDPMETQYVRNKFYIVKTAAPGGLKLRCVYCEADTDRFIVASKKHKWYTDDPAPLLRTIDLKE
jgi:hypothetical protein